MRKKIKKWVYVMRCPICVKGKVYKDQYDYPNMKCRKCDSQFDDLDGIPELYITK